MKEVIYKISTVLFLSAFLMLPAEDIKAQQGFDLTVTATQNPKGGDPRVFRLKNGDPLESAGGFRIKLMAQKNGRIKVKLNSSQGETVTLKESEGIEKGGELILPDRDKWYLLDSHAGTETIIIEVEDATGSKGINKFKIQHINPEENIYNTKELANNFKVGVKNKKSKIDSEKPLKSISLRGAELLLDQINSSNETEVALTRGVGSWIYRQYSNSVVYIKGEMYGSGFILKNGDIVTNWHVINGHKKVAVYLKSDLQKENYSGEFLVGNVVNFNKEKDLALVNIVGFPKKFQSVELGQLEDVEIGGEVHAIGHPGGGMLWTYTKGNISGYLKGYEWELEGQKFNQNVIQTQAPINPGNSGGPLFNNNGKLIGIMTWSASNLQLMNFAVAVDEIRTFLNKPQQEYGLKEKRKPDLLRFKDRNEDGVRDVLFLDTDHNGFPDKVLVDKDFNGTFEYVILDVNENDIKDGEGFDTDNDGYPDMYRLDLNEDKKIDLYGFDDNQDGEIDRFSKR
jgi:S1-C subfamily serine protease